MVGYKKVQNKVHSMNSQQLQSANQVAYLNDAARNQNTQAISGYGTQIRSRYTYAHLTEAWRQETTYDGFLKYKSTGGNNKVPYLPWFNLLYLLDATAGPGTYLIQPTIAYIDQEVVNTTVWQNKQNKPVKLLRIAISTTLTIFAADGTVPQQALGEVGEYPVIGDGFSTAQADSITKAGFMHGIGRHLKLG